MLNQFARSWEMERPLCLLEDIEDKLDYTESPTILCKILE